MAITPSTLGYWGTPTSSVDWCEQNYAHTEYVCELFNTLSSLAMVVVGLWGVYWHRRVLELRFMLVFGSVALVGLGSMAFHGSLLFEMQMLDELPMLYTSALLVYVLLENRPRRRFGIWLPAALLVYALSATYGAAFMRGNAQFWSFQVSFATLEFYAMYRVFLIHRASTDRTQRRLFRVGISLYLLAIGLWFIDIRYCAGIVNAAAAFGLHNPELHAWWHVLVSAGLYALVLVIAYDRCRILGRVPDWTLSVGVPHLKLRTNAER